MGILLFWGWGGRDVMGLCPTSIPSVVICGPCVTSSLFRFSLFTHDSCVGTTQPVGCVALGAPDPSCCPALISEAHCLPLEHAGSADAFMRLCGSNIAECSLRSANSHRPVRGANPLMDFSFDPDQSLHLTFSKQTHSFFFYNVSSQGGGAASWPWTPRGIFFPFLGAFGSSPSLTSGFLSVILSFCVPVFCVFCINDVVMYYNTPMWRPWGDCCERHYRKIYSVQFNSAACNLV